MMLSVLIVDDDLNIRELLSEFVKALGHSPIVADSGSAAISCIDQERVDLVIADLKMPGMDGLSLLRDLKSRSIDIPFVIITGYGSVESAVTAMKLGAYDYLEKPITLERLALLLEKVVERKKLISENIFLRDLYFDSKFFGMKIIGNCPAMQNIFDLLDKIRDKDVNVLIYGESGTGKELLATVIWKIGPRKKNVFIPVNCGAIVETLAESELFGHVKGAFTGALRDKKGLFEEANGGTIFLDEVTEFSLGMQVKLLRALEEKKIRRVGDSKLIDVDVRVLAATNRDPEEAVRSGILRKDLYFRLNVIGIHLPPLRERGEDIELLIEHFLRIFSPGNEQKELTKRAKEALISYSWPGNIRELQHAIQRATILATGRYIDLEHLPLHITSKGGYTISDTDSFSDLKSQELLLIKKALELTNGNKLEAAKRLGIHPSTLYRKLKKLGL